MSDPTMNEIDAIWGDGDRESLRTEIAMRAMQGWIIALGRRSGQEGYSDDSAANYAARLGRMSADALLAELNSSTQQKVSTQ